MPIQTALRTIGEQLDHAEVALAGAAQEAEHLFDLLDSGAAPERFGWAVRSQAQALVADLAVARATSELPELRHNVRELGELVAFAEN
jgi:hypothetical protein